MFVNKVVHPSIERQNQYRVAPVTGCHWNVIGCVWTVLFVGATFVVGPGGEVVCASPATPIAPISARDTVTASCDDIMPASITNENLP